MVNGSSGSGALMILVVEVRLLQKEGLDPFYDAFDICPAAYPANSGLSHLFGKLGRRVHGHHQDGRARRAHRYLSGGFQSVHHADLKIEHDDIEFLLLNFVTASWPFEASSHTFQWSRPSSKVRRLRRIGSLSSTTRMRVSCCRASMACGVIL